MSTWGNLMGHLLWPAVVALVLVACGRAPDPLFPEDLSSWAEGRPCAFSHEHELRYIRVFVDEGARIPYQTLSEDAPYPEGATLVKVEYDDEACTRVLGYTAMQKQPAGYSAEANDWRWQRLNRSREVIDDGALTTCITCHDHHCTAPQCGFPACGYDLTCGLEG